MPGVEVTIGLWIAIQIPYYHDVTLSYYIRVVGPIFSIQYYPAMYIVQNYLGVCHPNHIIMIRRFLDIYENNVHGHVGKIKISNTKAKENSLAPKTEDILIYNHYISLVNILIL